MTWFSYLAKPSSPHQSGSEGATFDPSNSLGTSIDLSFEAQSPSPRLPLASASPAASRRQAHGSRRNWLVSLSFCRDFHPATFQQLARHTRNPNQAAAIREHSPAKAEAKDHRVPSAHARCAHQCCAAGENSIAPLPGGAGTSTLSHSLPPSSQFPTMPASAACGPAIVRLRTPPKGQGAPELRRRPRGARP